MEFPQPHFISPVCSLEVLDEVVGVPLPLRVVPCHLVQRLQEVLHPLPQQCLSWWRRGGWSCRIREWTNHEQRWAWGVSWRCCSLLIFFFTRCHPYFLINSRAHHKLVLPQVTRFVKKHAFISAKFTMRVVWTHTSVEELCQILLHCKRT